MFDFTGHHNFHFQPSHPLTYIHIYTQTLHIIVAIHSTLKYFFNLHSAVMWTHRCEEEKTVNTLWGAVPIFLVVLTFINFLLIQFAVCSILIIESVIQYFFFHCCSAASSFCPFDLVHSGVVCCGEEVFG